MKVCVKLFGTLRSRFNSYDASKGMEVDIPDDSRVDGLLTHLGILPSPHLVIAVNGRIQKPEDRLADGSTVNIFQTFLGG